MYTPRQSAFSLALILLLATSLSAQDKKPDPNVEAAERTMAILESTADWKSLFNGSDLDGWTGDTQGYVAEDGMLVCRKGGKNLITNKEYGDFAFQFEFKLEESGNNGIGIRVPAGGHRGGPKYL